MPNLPEFYLRLLVPCDKEHVASEMTVTSTVAEVTSGLSGTYRRKRIAIYNNSNASSGEIFYGSGENGCVMPLPQGAMVELPIGGELGSELSLYVKMGAAGEFGDLRYWECA